jgi:DNA-binding IclR family transcriptional regulator
LHILEPEASGRFIEHAPLLPLKDCTVTDPAKLKEALEVKRRGYAIVDQKLELGLRVVAVTTEVSVDVPWPLQAPAPSTALQP